MSVARLTAAYAAAGQGRKSDADRAATELAQREADVQAAEGEILVASARLCEVLFLDPSIRLHPTDAWVVPHPIVPDPIPVCAADRAGPARTAPSWASGGPRSARRCSSWKGRRSCRSRRRSWLGFSAGGFGGGSNLVRPIFGEFGGRSDFDAVAYWTIQNMGVGNLALINVARARLGVTRYQEIAVLDRVRAEVAEAYARTHARYAQIGTTEHAVITATDGFNEDVIRLENTVGLPVELLDSLRLLARARLTYLDSIVDYNEAQFELFVALGQPPADMLARPVPTAGVVPPGQPIPVPPGTTARAAGPRAGPREHPGLVHPPGPRRRDPGTGSRRALRLSSHARGGTMTMGPRRRNADRRGAAAAARRWRPGLARGDAVGRPDGVPQRAGAGLARDDDGRAARRARTRPAPGRPESRASAPMPGPGRWRTTGSGRGGGGGPEGGHRRQGRRDLGRSEHPADRDAPRRAPGAAGVPDRPDDRAAAGRGREPRDRRSPGSRSARPWRSSSRPMRCCCRS